MSLAKVSLLNAVAVTVRTLSALVLNKILAVYVGPSGYALVGQLQSAVSIVANIVGAALGTGVTKNTAEHFDDDQRQRAFWQTAMRLSLWSTMTLAILLVLFREGLSTWLLHRADFSDVIVWLVIALPFMSVNYLLLAILNGKKAVIPLTISNIAASLIGLGLTGALSVMFALHGALIAIALVPALSLITSVYVLYREPWFKFRHLWGELDTIAVHQLAQFALMALAGALCVPLSHMIIRDILVARFGWTAAGHWQAVWKISEVYLAFFTATLSVYYLPRIAEIRLAKELASEIVKITKAVLPFVAASALCIYWLRGELVGWLFTAEFSPMTELLPWQLAGDVLKIAAWIFSYVLIGRAMTTAFIATEIIFSVSFVLFGWFWTNQVGLQGIAIAHFCNYASYLCTMFLLVKRELKKMTK